ncbi:hypothetical protein J8C02_11035 [Chloracidobacterium sp. MS 40/45]|uniref:hypothetical protein n=1 Tax=Chloracidobacterium aggregatum TaxID=2851959 RepID=UPI001B8C6B48|nr:hypothetical protein [Chloracidobacterium aggregatum]QUV99919.1 hypothetical protein J8C02_11035 [Chloracidobacterium sp. MS 40/45]
MRILASFFSQFAMLPPEGTARHIRLAERPDLDTALNGQKPGSFSMKVLKKLPILH